MSTGIGVGAGHTYVPGARAHRGRLVRVLGWELEKLTAQLRVRLALAVCLVGPFGFAIGLKLTHGVPADTLFGRLAVESGSALPLVVLGFAAAWGFPILTCLVAGDIFSTEDAHGTWVMLSTRSTGRGTLFTGKVLAVAVYVIAALLVLSMASLAAGLLVIGNQALIGLSGNLLDAGRASGLALLAWLCVLPTALAFAGVGVLLSVMTRSSIAAVIGAVVVGLAMQLGTLVDGIGPVRDLLLGSGFLSWHGLFTEPVSIRPVLVAAVVALGYLLVCLGVSWLVLRRRDVSNG